MRAGSNRLQFRVVRQQREKRNPFADRQKGPALILAMQADEDVPVEAKAASDPAHEVFAIVRNDPRWSPARSATPSGSSNSMCRVDPPDTSDPSFDCNSRLTITRIGRAPSELTRRLIRSPGTISRLNIGPRTVGASRSSDSAFASEDQSG